MAYYVHGHTDSPTYVAWHNMRLRGRVEAWDTFAGFLVDMGEKPSNSRLVRLDVTQPYGPDNARWALGDVKNDPAYSCWKSIRTSRSLAVTPVCEAWSSFETFLDDMRARPEGARLLRKDKAQGFSPENCAWGEEAVGTKHGGAGTLTYQAWNNMRIVGLVEAWNTFEGFRSDMGDRPENSRIKRLDKTQPHGPGNTYWDVAGIKDHELFSTWSNMIARCENPKDKRFEHYGGRGISLCPQWRASFSQFVSDMGERPSGYTIDRKNNNLGYSPDNCRWATNTEQGRNRGITHNLVRTSDGVAHNIAGWIEELELTEVPRLRGDTALFARDDAQATLKVWLESEGIDLSTLDKVRSRHTTFVGENA